LGFKSEVFLQNTAICQPPLPLERIKNRKPIIWIHVEFDKNARSWESFGSRTSDNLNQPYQYLTIRNIIEHCGESFNVCLIDDDAFVKTLGFGVETVSELREKVREQLVKQAEEEMKSESQSALLDLLVKDNNFKVPAAMVDDEIRGIVARYGLGGKGANPESLDVSAFREQFSEFALNRIRCAIIIDRIGAAEEIKVEDADREQMIQRVAEQNGSTVEATRKTLLDKSRIMSFLLEVRRTKILDHLMSKTTVEYTDEPTKKQK